MLEQWSDGTTVKIPSMPSRAGSAIANLGFAVDCTVQMARKAGASGLGTGAVSVLPGLGFLVGGALLVAGLEAGPHWAAAGILLAFVGSVASAWVLLVEIRR